MKNDNPCRGRPHIALGRNNGSTQKQHAEAARKGFTQRLHAKAARKGCTQRLLAEAARKGCSQRLLAKAAREGCPRRLPHVANGRRGSGVLHAFHGGNRRSLSFDKEATLRGFVICCRSAKGSCVREAAVERGFVDCCRSTRKLHSCSGPSQIMRYVRHANNIKGLTPR
jgi:hypothetical protein